MNEDNALGLRRAEIRVALDREFADRGIEATNRRDWLINGVDQSAAARAYLIGIESTFDPREVADQIASSEYGSIAVRGDEAAKEHGDREAQLAMISTLPRDQRINAARRLGLV